MNKAILFSALLGATALVSTAPAQAADHIRPVARAHFHHVIARHPHFALRHDFRHFTPAEHRWWTGGRWRHTSWHGRYGWWWNIGPSWYFYDAPAYPYPSDVSPTYDDDENYDDDDQGGYDDQGQGGYSDQGQGGGYNDQGPGPDQQDMGPGYGGGGPGVWYHCNRPEGYYPYVKQCRGGWEQVPAQPSDMQGPGPQGGPGGPNGGPPPGYNGGDDQGPPPPQNGR
jgi:hypothetical protein